MSSGQEMHFVGKRGWGCREWVECGGEEHFVGKEGVGGGAMWERGIGFGGGNFVLKRVWNGGGELSG